MIVAVDTESEALPPFIATTLLFEGAYATFFYLGMIIMVGKALFYSYPMIIQEFSIPAYIYISWSIPKRALH